MKHSDRLLITIRQMIRSTNLSGFFGKHIGSDQNLPFEDSEENDMPRSTPMNGVRME